MAAVIKFDLMIADRHETFSQIKLMCSRSCNAGAEMTWILQILKKCAGRTFTKANFRETMLGFIARRETPALTERLYRSLTDVEKEALGVTNGTKIVDWRGSDDEFVLGTDMDLMKVKSRRSLENMCTYLVDLGNKEIRMTNMFDIEENTDMPCDTVINGSHNGKHGVYAALTIPFPELENIMGLKDKAFSLYESGEILKMREGAFGDGTAERLD